MVWWGQNEGHPVRNTAQGEGCMLSKGGVHFPPDVSFKPHLEHTIWRREVLLVWEGGAVPFQRTGTKRAEPQAYLPEA